MLGSEGVARYLMLALQARVPVKLHEIRTRLTEQLDDPVTPRDLPEVQRWIPWDVDQLEVGAFPAILVTEIESTGRIANRQQETGLTYDEWTFEYLMRVFVWVMGDSGGGTALMRNRMVQAIEESLLGDKKLYESDIEQIAVNGTSIRHSYSDAAIDEAGQVLQAGYVEIRCQTIERVNTIVPPYQPEGVPISTNVSVNLSLDTDLD